MAIILHIESATGICAVALAQNNNLIAEKYSSEPRTHAQFLTIYIEQLLAASGFAFNQLDAICVSKGPGSYTGLRIGVAIAKGLCFALEKPLIAVNTLFSMSACMKKQIERKEFENQNNLLFCPMIDARRMEVYTAIYDWQLEEVSGTNVLIVNSDSFMEYSSRQLIFFGDGAEKLKAVINPSSNVIFVSDFEFSAIGMIAEANRRFDLQQFENTAYFEPYYLKEFVGKKVG